jgi:hypothetical protein
LLGAEVTKADNVGIIVGGEVIDFGFRGIWD